ncbi:MAG: acyltransferase family protein [Fimbriimonas sp.]
MTPPARQGQHDRLAFLEGMRGLAALYVMVGHFCSMSDPGAIFLGKPKSPGWLQAVMSPFWYGHLAVASFLVISGFCLQLSLFGRGDGELRDVRSFFRRRALRILPPYYACLVLSLIVCATVTVRYPVLPFSQYVPVTPESLVAHVLLVHNFNPAWMYKINGVLWSIAIEAQMYLLFPAMSRITHWGARWGLLVLCLLISGSVLMLVPESLKLYPWYLALFAGGMVAAHCAYRPHPVRGLQPSAAWSTVILSALACGVVSAFRVPLPISDLCVGLTCAALCYALTIEPSGWVFRFLSWDPLVRVGAFSYSLYLMHHPIQQVIYHVRPAWVSTELRTFGYLLACSPIILMLCYVFHLAVERPFMRRQVIQAREDSVRLIPAALPLVPSEQVHFEPHPTPSARVETNPASQKT